MAAIGLIATMPAFIICYMRLEGRERWSLTLPMAAATTLFIYGSTGFSPSRGRRHCSAWHCRHSEPFPACRCSGSGMNP
jgi:hypothetical protein